MFDYLNALVRIPEVRKDLDAIDKEPNKEKRRKLRSKYFGMDGIQVIDRDFYEFGYKTFELSKLLYSQYGRAGYEDKAKILKFVASNYTINDISLCLIYRKPFDMLGEGLSHTSWLPTFEIKRQKPSLNLPIR